MADIFISYDSEDRSRVEPIAKALEQQGWSVFWDQTIPAGQTWRQVIGEALESARSVIVAWSEKSVESSWVQEEADRGLERNILIPILIDNVKPPLGFGAIQAADLTNWKPKQSSPEFEKLIADISAIVDPSTLKVNDAEEKTAKEGQKRRNVMAEIKNDKPEPVKAKPSEFRSDAMTTTKLRTSALVSLKPRKTINALKLGIVAAVAVLLIGGIWWWFSQPFGLKADEAFIKGKKYYAEQKYRKALAFFQYSAEQGSGEAMTKLGLIYEKGLGGMPIDYKEAVRWYLKAADAGDSAAMNNLGSIYKKGLVGVRSDYKEAVHWYRKAAEAEDTAGMINLGHMYKADDLGGLQKDYKEAVHWYRKAAEAGDPTGMINLGHMYKDGKGVTKDIYEAQRWYRKAEDAME